MTSRPIPHLTLAALLLATAAGTVEAQRSPRQVGDASLQKITGPIVQLPTYRYDFTTGRGAFIAVPNTGGSSGAQRPQWGRRVRRSLQNCYNNNSTTGYYSPVTAGMELVDWGDKSCGTTGFIGAFTIGYATTAQDPDLGGPGASLDIALYDGTSGGGDSFLGTEVARLSFSGLEGSTGPGPAGYLLPVVLTSPVPMGDGDVGWGFVGVDGLTGPLLVATSGGCFFIPDPSTGTEDCYDLFTAPASAGGNYQGTFQMPNPGTGSFYITLDEHDGSSTTSSVINGTGVNPLIFSELETPMFGQPWQTTFDLTSYPGAATIVAICDDPFPPIPLSFGELFVDIGTPSLLALDISLGNHTNLVPRDITLAGNTIYTQGAVFLTGTLTLVNGIAFTLGL